MKIITNNLKETFELAKNFANKIVPGTIITLSGDLGTGKTAFTKGLAAGLGIKNEIKSPTFTLMNVYQTDKSPKCQLVHFDTYRLKNEQQFIDIGGVDYLIDQNSICVVEWPDKIAGLLENKKVTNISFRHLSENSREINFEND